MFRLPQSLPPAADVSEFWMLPPPQAASTSAAVAATVASPSRRVLAPSAFNVRPFISPGSHEPGSRVWSATSVAGCGLPHDPVDHHPERGDRDAGGESLAEQLGLRESGHHDVAE